MPLRYRLKLHKETYVALELAANARYLEGRALLRDGYHAAGVYLLGYSAEMWLKSAYFRFSGARPTDEIMPLIYTANGVAKRFNLRLDKSDGYHDINFWAQLLREQRAHERRPMPDLIDKRFVSRTRRLYQNWWIGMRYRPDLTTALEAKTMFEDVTWLRNSYRDLWR